MSFDDEAFSPRAREPEKSSSTCLVLGLVFGGVGSVVLLCGGCCVGAIFIFLNQVEQGARQDLAANPVVQEHIGEIQSFEMRRVDSLNADGDYFVFDVVGAKGSGTIEAECLDDGEGTYEVWSGELRMNTGETYDLFPDGDRWETEGFSELMDDMDTDGFLDVDDAEFARQVQVAVQDNPIFQERIGEVTEFTYDLDLSIEEEGFDTYVFHVKGSNGSGMLRAECITVDADTEDVPSAELVMESGDRVQLYPDNPLP